MLAPFATLVFLLVIWLAIAIVSGIFAGSGARIAAAVRGEAPPSNGTSLVIRSRPALARLQRHQPMRAQPQMRAAA